MSGSLVERWRALGTAPPPILQGTPGNWEITASGSSTVIGLLLIYRGSNGIVNEWLARTDNSTYGGSTMVPYEITPDIEAYTPPPQSGEPQTVGASTLSLRHNEARSIFDRWYADHGNSLPSGGIDATFFEATMTGFNWQP